MSYRNVRTKVRGGINDSRNTIYGTFDKVDALQTEVDSLKSRVVQDKTLKLKNEIKALKNQLRMIQ